MSMAHLAQPSPDRTALDSEVDGPGQGGVSVDGDIEDLAESEEGAQLLLVEAITEVDIDRVEQEYASEAEVEDEAQRRARLANDHKIVLAIQADLAAGGRDLFKRAVDPLAQYALPILRRWLSSGEIFAKVNEIRERANQTRARSGRGPLPLIRRSDADWGWLGKEKDLVFDLLVEGVERFRRTVQAGQWDPSRGASLKTYFVGACLVGFDKVYRQRRTERALHRAVVRAGSSDDLAVIEPFALTRSGRGPEAQVILRDQVDRVLAKIPDLQMRDVLVYRAQGYTQREAAERSGLSEKAAEGRLARLRKQLARENTAPGTHADSDGAER
ncbi:hypothetical protein GCM10023194_74840 [Planotetraspora phitsanulokensis]|uniref:RNA polymerase sigma factor 70 region 4 type 2 domain-containing protein n=1 Tax=Planotetraspora phitsanulokensis TaxID=575192 RepID=A0A8J3U2H4_9ACTN|nr:sigma-70 region 4 domain-containing protein [Planotetraspora phitsanulokensis]GII37016.1 hypothetical protein Pph01_20190 [Planotetraspora phitsanulokensis]